MFNAPDDFERVPSRAEEVRALKRAFIRAFAVLGDTRAASAKIGVSTQTGAQWLLDGKVREAVLFERQNAITLQAGGVSYHALVEIVTKQRADFDTSDDPYVYPGALRAKVATDLIRLAGHTEAAGAAMLQSQRVARLDELSEDQLAAHIAEAQRLLSASPASGDAPSEDEIASLL